MNRSKKLVGYTALAYCIVSANGCNLAIRTAEGLGRLGERMYTGVCEDWDSVKSNYKKHPYRITTSQEATVEDNNEERPSRPEINTEE